MVTDDPADLANSADYDEYLDRMEEVFGSCDACCATAATPRVIVRDAYQDGRYRFTGADLAARAERAGFVTEGRPHLVPGRHAATAVRLPAGFVPNIVHQHILVLRKEPTKADRGGAPGRPFAQ